jgi:hypothetical protein
LLKKDGVVVSEHVIANAVLNFPAAMMVLASCQQARILYDKAKQVPQSRTRIILAQQGISVGEVYAGAFSCNTVLLHAHEQGEARILKVGTVETVDHEFSVWEAISKGDKDYEYLVPLRKIVFERGTKIEVGSKVGEFKTVNAEDCGAGLLMKQYQSTLANVKIPSNSKVLLRIGGQLLEAVETMHACGYCHMDIKPSNIFLWEKECFLGDYGGATLIGDTVRETTQRYYPRDAGDKALKKNDFLMLAVTLLELFGALENCILPMTCCQIKDVIESEENDEVKAFLKSFTLEAIV